MRIKIPIRDNPKYIIELFSECGSFGFTLYKKSLWGYILGFKGNLAINTYFLEKLSGSIDEVSERLLDKIHEKLEDNEIINESKSKNAKYLTTIYDNIKNSL